MPERSALTLWLERLPLVLLVVVGIAQLALAHSADLSPWLGGGFGMFSTSDDRSHRHLHLIVLTPGVESDVELPAALGDVARRVRALPTRQRLESLGRRVIAALRLEAGTTLRIEIWRTRFDPETLRPSSHVLRAIEIPVGEGADT